MASLAVNSTFLTIAAFLIAVLTAWIAGTESPLSTLKKLLSITTSWPVIGILVVGALLNSGFRIYTGSLNPIDLMQDIVAGDQLIGHQPMYPGNLPSLVNNQMQRYPPLIELHNLPAWAGMDQRPQFTLLSVNAHPPFLGLLLAFFLPFMNFRWIYLIVTIVTSIVLVAAIRLILDGLGVTYNWKSFLAVIALAFGWHPVLSTLTTGQTSILLAGFMVLAWWFLRKGNSALAGALVGIAAAIKIFPALLIVYFLLRNLRAFAAGVTTFLSAQLIALAFCGIGNYIAFLKVLADLWRPLVSRTDISFFALLSGFMKASTLRVVAPLVLAAGVAALVSVIANHRKVRNVHALDLEYSACMVMMPLLAPVAWSHYLVVLILPLAVLASHLLQRTLSWVSTAAYLSLLFVFAIPDTTVKVLQLALQSIAGYYLSWFLTSTFVFGLLVLLAWLARSLILQTRDISDPLVEKTFPLPALK